MKPLRLCSVLGYEGRINDVLYHPPVIPNDTPNSVIFFGGDIQDLPEIMETHKENRNYIKWNLINMASILSYNFPKSHVLVIRPSRVEFKSFSCYDNFVPGNNAGVPEHTPTHYSLQHLERLLQGVTHMLKTMSPDELLDSLDSQRDTDIDVDVLQADEMSTSVTDENKDNMTPSDMTACNLDANPTSIVNNTQQTTNTEPQKTENILWWRTNLSLDKTNLTIIGFSKGCVVLNQFIYEFHYLKTLTPDDTALNRIVNRITDMYWLDGGHAGAKNTWITSRSLLETLARLGVNIYVHVSPYQVQDDRRPWIGREERTFMNLLKKLDAKVWRYFHHSPGISQTLQTHFDVLTTFKHLQDNMPTTMVESSDEET